MWRRIRLIPFRVTFEPDQQDPKLTDKLMAELPGILQWALRGCEWWRSDGLKPPSVVTDATAQYREDQDVFGRFIDDCCVIGSQFEANGGVLYTRYRSWCETNGEHPMTQTAFGRKLTERGFERRHTMDGKIRLGLALASKDTS